MPDTSFIFIHCLTSLHPGSGTALGVVDLPVQRERHTLWPTIPGSSLKGVMRAACERNAGKFEANDTAFVSRIFGTGSDNSDQRAGLMSISDARILAFPVRSLKGVFAWVTCPDVLARFGRDFRIAGGTIGFPEIPDVSPDEVVLVDNTPLLAGKASSVLFEEFEFTRAKGTRANHVADWVANLAIRDPETSKRFCSHLAILNNSDFTYFVRHATEVNARIGLDYKTKTARPRALFYEEALPSETLFYALSISDTQRQGSNQADVEGMLEKLRGTIPQVLQIGGSQSIGKGLCAVHFFPVNGEGK